MAERQDYLEDGSPLIKAAELGKMRLVRLLVEGGAQVNERNQRGETPLLATCQALRADQSGNTTSLRLIRFLLQHHADPNAQDKFGRTPLMYACMERAGAEVATALISAGADPSMEDYAGGSALVYGINSRDQDTIRVLLDACRAKGRDIIIISTDLSTGGATVGRRYLNVPPSPDTSPVACMSPSDIELKTGSPNSETEGEGIFNFRASGRRGSRAASPLLLEPEASDCQRLSSEPWLAIHNLAHLSRTYEERITKGAVQEEEDKEVKHSSHDSLAQQVDQSSSSKTANLKPGRTFCRNHAENFASPTQAHLHNRRNTLPALPGQNLLQLPTLSLNLSSSDTHLHDQPSTITLPPVPTSRNLYHSPSNTSSCSLAPPAAQCGFNTMRKWKPQEQLSLKPQTRNTTFLPPLSVSSTANTSTCSCGDEASTAPKAEETQSHRQEGAMGRRPPRRHSIQLEQMRQEGGTDEILFIL
ncbi:ankyrin repeat domain-containing protein 34B [Pangasianodon hypophthalmus]|uniref:ankyrin repeat domain-containing protein 34B n=1 Tax=Pangasianodon hypophthalmus TaxID=310915 RepID=UPI0023072334|nr:ankyrin repeat domain-containing protein 34B [Pangasianodon hypophthalmus]